MQAEFAGQIVAIPGRKRIAEPNAGFAV